MTCPTIRTLLIIYIFIGYKLIANSYDVPCMRLYYTRFLIRLTITTYIPIVYACQALSEIIQSVSTQLFGVYTVITSS
jgi:hypothetical protein